MSEFNYTYGPWQAVEYVDCFKLLKITFHGEIHLFDKNDCEDAKYNARLAAAAPELLEACKTLLEANRKMASWIVNNDRTNHAFTGMEADLIGLEAIKKATL